MKPRIFSLLLSLLGLLIISGCGSSGSLVKKPTNTVTNESSVWVRLTSNSTNLLEYDTTPVTITATASFPLSFPPLNDIVVTLSSTGTATDGADYSAVDGKTITIPSGSTSGTISVSAVNDTLSEGDETATISIASVSGGTELGDQYVHLTINEGLNVDIQSFATFNLSHAQLIAATDEFKWFNAGNSIENPLLRINAHKAAGYGLTGEGQTIAIMDAGFNLLHQEFSEKEITVLGTMSQAADGMTASHGTAVSGFAAAEDDGKGMQGVAPKADLIWSSYNQTNGYTYMPDAWAALTKSSNKAVVQNNSWGLEYQIDDLVDDIALGGYDAYTATAGIFNSGGYTANDVSVKNYIDALDAFQTHGVVVYALSNDDTFTDADFQAGFPVVFPQLQEAWISATNVEVLGHSSGTQTYTRVSAPCGQTGPYCLAADGHSVTGPTWGEGVLVYTTYHTGGGTSFVAPMISGAIALLAEAFPTSPPSVWRDRLLATADNSFFTHSGVTTFANGYQHGYNLEFGHGIFDIWKALQPITTSGQTRVFVGKSVDSHYYPLSASSISTSRSFGDSVYKGLKGLSGFTYDDFGGGFRYQFANHVTMAPNDVAAIEISSELSKLSDTISDTSPSNWKLNFNQVVANFAPSETIKTDITIGSAAVPVQSFFESNIDTNVDLSKFRTPYLTSGDNGLGIGTSYELGDSRLLFGMTMPAARTNREHVGDTKTFTTSVEHGSPNKQAVTLMAGVTQEQDRLLGSVGGGAFSLAGARSTTTFATLKAQTQLLDNIFLTGISTIARTNMSTPRSSLVGASNNVESSSHGLVINKRSLLGSDNLSVFVTQPNRISSGSMNVRIPTLADLNGTIIYNTKSIDLEPSSHQLNYGISYKKNISDQFSLAFKHVVTDNPNHIDTGKSYHSSFAGLRYKNTKLGFATDPLDSGLEFKLTYSTLF